MGCVVDGKRRPAVSIMLGPALMVTASGLGGLGSAKGLAAIVPGVPTSRRAAQRGLRVGSG